jgi:hypothetical protein
MRTLRVTVPLACLGVVLMAPASVRAQYATPCYQAPAVALYAPVPVEQPVVPFVGSSYAFRAPTYSPYYASYYAPVQGSAYAAPSYYQPRYLNPGPYYYTATYSYTPGYYSFYYTPGYFRY